MSPEPGSLGRSLPPSAFLRPCRAKLAYPLSRKRSLSTCQSERVAIAVKYTAPRSRSLGSSCGLVHRPHLQAAMSGCDLLVGRPAMNLVHARDRKLADVQIADKSPHS